MKTKTCNMCKTPRTDTVLIDDTCYLCVLRDLIGKIENANSSISILTEKELFNFKLAVNITLRLRTPLKTIEQADNVIKIVGLHRMDILNCICETETSAEQVEDYYPNLIKNLKELYGEHKIN